MSNGGYLRINMHLFTEDERSAIVTSTINSNSFTVDFSGEQNLNRRLHWPFVQKGNSPALNSATPKFIFRNLSSFLFLLKNFYGGVKMNLG